MKPWFLQKRFSALDSFLISLGLWHCWAGDILLGISILIIGVLFSIILEKGFTFN
jgi:hypothetical protein